MKTLPVLLILLIFTACELNESYNFAYRIETDTEITSDIIYYLNSFYEGEEITTPWQSDSMTIADDFFSFYIEIEHSPYGGRIYILRDGAIWKTQKFYPGYHINFSEAFIKCRQNVLSICSRTLARRDGGRAAAR